MIRVLIATPDAELGSRATALLAETGDTELAETAETGNEAMALLSGEGRTPNVVVLHEDIGPLPVLDLARDLSHRFPQVGVILLSEEPSMELMRSAMSAGIRSVLGLPLTLSELHRAVLEANEWAVTVQGRLAAAGDGRVSRSSMRGNVIALTGAKGGVGTTTMAVQLALEYKRSDPDASVCLVDLDLQTGDVRALMDVTHKRSITDLVDVAGELTTGQLEDAMYAHPSGVRVLLPPRRGEDGEDLDGTTAARIVGGIRARYDVVILDCGTVLTMAGAAALELADEAIVVCTPDVLALRGANRALKMWDRLAVRADDISVLINRASREREVQPSLIEKVVTAPVLKHTVPERPREVEGAANTGEPERVEGAVAKAIGRVATEISQLREESDEPDVDETEDTLEQRVRAEDGALSVEFVSLILPIAFMLLVVWQFILVGFTMMMAQQAAGDGARYVQLYGYHEEEDDVEDDDECLDGSHALVEEAGEHMFGHWSSTLCVPKLEDNPDVVEVSIRVPILVPGLFTDWDVTAEEGVVPESSSVGERWPQGRPVS